LLYTSREIISTILYIFTITFVIFIIFCIKSIWAQIKIAPNIP
jgi:F0F1-type ATP synthase membrane subunit b/b'